MKNYLFLSLVVIFNYFVINVLAKNEYYLISIKGDSNEEYDKASKKIQRKIDSLVNDRMNDIYDVIAENREAYKDDKKIEEVAVTSQLRKRSDKQTKIQFINKNRPQKTGMSLNAADDVELIPFESKLVVHIAPVSNYYVVIAYLPESLVKEVKKMPNVISVNKSHKLKKQADKYYDLKAIKEETKWKDVSVQENPFDYELRNSALSMMSQTRYNLNSTHPYDFNYYYPSTAGKGIDIYVIDDGLDASLSEDNFDTYKGTPDERVVKCDGIFYDGQFHSVPNERKCIIEFNGVDAVEGHFNHGTSVAISALGTLNGAAKKANLHSLAIEYYTYDVLTAFDYIKQHAKPHKSVVNISSGLYEDEAEFSLKEVQDKIKELNEYGIIIVVSAGNDSLNCCKGNGNVDRIYGAVEGVIHVGALNNRRLNEYGNMEKLFEIASYSNYGPCVDIFTPGTVRVTNKKNEIIMTTSGTSFASPFTAGIVATLMAENSDVQYDFESMRKLLIDLSIKDVISGLPENTPNRLINNGKRSVYGTARCDDAAGEKCKDQCCTKYGVCANPKVAANQAMCLVENGCNSEFGFCSTKKCDKDHKCGKNECCTKDGNCVASTNALCLIENGCQTELGNCTTKKLCGKQHGKNKCGEDECCTKEGTCVNIFNDKQGKCFIENGCMRRYSGECLSENPLITNMYDKKYHDVIRTWRCQKEINKYNKCKLDEYYNEREYFVDIKKRNNICKKYERDGCKKIIKNPSKYFPVCKKNNKMDMVENFVEHLKYENLYCARRNPRNREDYCVVNNDKMYAVYGALSEVIIDDFCIYDECRESYLDIVKHDFEEMKSELEGKTDINERVLKNFLVYEKAIKLMTEKKCDKLAEIDFYLY